jgi:AhpD family alkylhydroperoxidase
VHERMNPHTAAPELRKPMAGLTQHIAGNIDPVLFELIKLYASMLNGCGQCIDIHAADALKAGESAARLFGMLAWHESPFYSPKERAALALTEAATRFGPHGVPDEVFEAARIEFDDRELTYVVAAIGLINMWNRFGVTFQLSPPSAVALTGER